MGRRRIWRKGDVRAPVTARQVRDANQERLQADIAEGDRVARGFERREVAVHGSCRNFRASARSRSAARIAFRWFRGRGTATCAKIARHRRLSGAPATCGRAGRAARRRPASLDRGALLARGGQLFRDAQLSRAAPSCDRAFSAPRRFRRAHRRAQLHHGLVPVAGSVASEQILRGGLRASATVAGARRSPRTAPIRASTRATFPSSTASGSP